MRNEPGWWVRAFALLAIAWGSSCLNPRPEDFPSAQPPGETDNPGGGGEDGQGQGPPADDPDPTTPSTETPPNTQPPSGGMTGAADSGVASPDAAADAGADAN